MGYVASGRPVGRPRQFYKYELPSGVVKVVRAQCADYARKELCIKEGSVSGETLGAYIAVNAAINLALADIEEAVRQHFLNDIAEVFGIGKLDYIGNGIRRSGHQRIAQGDVAVAGPVDRQNQGVEMRLVEHDFRCAGLYAGTFCAGGIDDVAVLLAACKRCAESRGQHE